MDSLASRVYAITGISGIGLGVAKHLLAHGALISIADISQSALDSAVATLNASPDVLLATVVDVGSASQVNDWIDATVAKFGRLDGAANMAGVIGKHHGIRDLADQDDDQWDLLLRVNLTGVMYCMRAQLRAIAKKGDAGEGKGKGSIVNAASIQGLIGFPKHAAYCATKHAVIGLSKSTAREVAPDVRVNCVAPGSIMTPLLEEAIDIQKRVHVESVINRPGTVEEVAQVVVFLLSDAASYVTSAVYRVDGGWQ